MSSYCKIYAYKYSHDAIAFLLYFPFNLYQSLSSLKTRSLCLELTLLIILRRSDAWATKRDMEGLDGSLDFPLTCFIKPFVFFIYWISMYGLYGYFLRNSLSDIIYMTSLGWNQNLSLILVTQHLLHSLVLSLKCLSVFFFFFPSMQRHMI